MPQEDKSALLSEESEVSVTFWPSTLPPCRILSGVIDRVAAAGADHVERMWGVALNTYKTECDICGAVNEVPNYGDWDCCQCGQGYNYDEAHQITLTDAQLALLRNPPRWIPVSERLPEEGVEVLAWLPCDERACAGCVRDEYWYSPDIRLSDYPDRGDPEGPTHWMPLPEPPEVRCRS